MRQGFRPSIEPLQHRKAVVEARRPWLCIALTLTVVLLVFAIFGVSAWNVYEHRFHKNTHFFHANDEVSLNEVSDDLSAVFCEGYTVALLGSGQVFLLPRQAAVNTTFLDTTHVNLNQQPFRILNVLTTYLLAGSIVNVTACRERGANEPGARIVLIRGDDDFQDWRKNSNCGDCILDHTDISWDASCESAHERNHARLEHKVRKNDMYFLLVYFGRPQRIHHQQSAEIRLRGVLQRTHFDITNAERVCNDVSCHFYLPWMSQKDVVVRLERDFRHNHRNFTTQCQARVIFWVGLFGIVPIVAVIPVSLLFAWFLCRLTQRNARALRQRQEQRRIRQSAPMDNGGNINFVAQNEDYGSVAIQES